MRQIDVQEVWKAVALRAAIFSLFKTLVRRGVLSAPSRSMAGENQSTKWPVLWIYNCKRKDNLLHKHTELKPGPKSGLIYGQLVNCKRHIPTFGYQPMLAWITTGRSFRTTFDPTHFRFGIHWHYFQYLNCWEEPPLIYTTVSSAWLWKIPL